MNFGINAPIAKDRNFIFLLIVGVIFLNMLPVPVLSPILILLLGIMLGLFIIFIFAHEDFKFLLSIFLIALLSRVFLSFLFYIFSFITESNNNSGFFWVNDGFSYDVQGWEIFRFAERGIKITMANYMSNSNMPISSGNITKYDFFTSHVYSITGRSPLSLFFISSVAGSLAALFVYLIAKELFSKNVARISSFIAFFWPSFILWSTQHLKEPMIAMLFCMLLWTIFYMYNHACPGFLLLSIMSFWALFKVGLPYAVVLMLTFFFTGLFLFIRHLFKGKSISIFVTILLLCVTYFLLQERIFQLIFEAGIHDIKGHGSLLEYLNFNRSVRAVGRLQFLKNADISSFGKLAGFVPLGLVYALFAPFPWNIGSTSQIMVIPETIIFYILFPFTLRGLVFSYKKRFNQGVFLIFIITAVILLVSMVDSNAGTLFRHRSVAFYLLFIFTAVGLSLKRPSKNAL